jgi:septum formation protein
MPSKMNWLPPYNYILASKSPRRQELLLSLGIEFRVVTKDIDEHYPNHLTKEEIPIFLAELKAKSILSDLKDNDLLITADTIVWHDNTVLGKPKDKGEAIGMLKKLSGCEHMVISGVCLSSTKKQHSFNSISNVRFKVLSEGEIDYYVSNYKPYDKAGGYGIQEWIGFVGITGIEGSFYNVMGMPVQQLYEEIMAFDVW